MKIPYGVADFYSLRTAGSLYVDRTDRVAVVEELGKSVLFLRPRRFGKSLWLSTLACYYDLRLEGEHQRLFGDLAIGRKPTPLAHRYFVLRWDFSEIDLDPPPRGVNARVSSRSERIGNEIHSYLNSTILSLLSDYREHLPEVKVGDDSFRSLDRLLDAIRATPFRLYLLIDEYDNFANEVLTADKAIYEELVHSDGPFKFLFKWVQAAMGGKGVDRLFITGVSPLVMSDVTSGMNIARNVYLKPVLADLCGFTEGEVDELIATASRERRDSELSAADVKQMMREWYNGYRFALGVPERVYNPTLVFYFLLDLQNLMPLGASRSAADAILFAFLRSGDLEPLLDFIETTLFSTFSNRDATRANELTVKTVFLALLWNDTSYITYSEPELNHRYADLCLLRRPDARASSLWDLLFEFKRLSLKELGMNTQDVKAASRAELMKHPKVKVALDQAEAQASDYRAALTERLGTVLQLRAFAVVALGFGRLVARPLASAQDVD